MTGGVFTISGGLTEPVFDEIVVVLAVALGGAATVDLNYFNFYLNSLKKLDEKKRTHLDVYCYNNVAYVLDMFLC